MQEFHSNIYSTKDYSLFKIMKGNRSLNQLNLKRLSDSMKENLLVCPIMLNEKYEIIDGQHRFHCCKELGLPVYFFINEDYGLEEVQVVNNNSSNWKKIDYLNSFCDLGFPEYVKLKNFCSLHKEFSINMCEIIARGNGNYKRTSMTEDGRQVSLDKFNLGEFVFEDVNDANTRIENIKKVSPYYKGYQRRNFILALMNAMSKKGYDHDEFINKLSYQSSKLVDCTNTKNYMDIIHQIYNYKRSKKVNLRDL